MPICKPHTLRDNHATVCVFARGLAFWSDDRAYATGPSLSPSHQEDCGP